MALVTTRALVDAARAAGDGVAAFNAITLEHAEAIVDGAEAAGAGVIVAVSENAVRYRRADPRPLAAACIALAEAASVPVALHLDHVEDQALLKAAPEAGFSSVMFDASMLEYAANVAATRAAADWAHEHGMWVEAELGEVGGKDGVHVVGAGTDPDEAVAYVEATGVDGLAVAVGTSHAMADRTARLDHERITALRAVVAVPLVLHGSSGVPDEELRRAVGEGIVKVNVGTRLNVALTGAVRERLASDAAMVDSRKYLGPGRDAMARAVTDALRAIGCAGVAATSSTPACRTCSTASRAQRSPSAHTGS